MRDDRALEWPTAGGGPPIACVYQTSDLEGFDKLDGIDDRPVAREGTSAADPTLLTAQSGRLRRKLKHLESFEEAERACPTGETPILAGTRAAIEAALFAAEASKEDDSIATVPSPGLIKTRWEIGGAVKSDPRGFASAVADARSALIAGGRSKAI